MSGRTDVSAFATGTPVSPSHSRKTSSRAHRGISLRAQASAAALGERRGVAEANDIGSERRRGGGFVGLRTAARDPSTALGMTAHRIGSGGRLWLVARGGHARPALPRWAPRQFRRPGHAAVALGNVRCERNGGMASSLLFGVIPGFRSESLSRLYAHCDFLPRVNVYRYHLPHIRRRFTPSRTEDIRTFSAIFSSVVQRTKRFTIVP